MTTEAQPAPDVQPVTAIDAAILLTPLLYLAHYAIDRYLGPAETAELQEEAVNNDSV